MVTIVTGKINSGKTTFLENLYHKNKSGDGFIARKYFLNGGIHHFTLERLSNKDTYSWMIHQKFYQNEFEKAEKFGPYYMNLETLEIVTSIYDDLLKLRISPLFVDEVGVLELQKKGYYTILNKLLANQIEVIFSAREDLVDSLVHFFKISDYQVKEVKIKEKNNV